MKKSKEKKIKILFLIGSYGTGGKERQLAELIKGLDPERFELHLLIKSDGAHYLENIKDNLTTLHNLNRERFGWRAITDIAKVIREVKPDIVHSWAEITSSMVIIIKLLTFNSFKLLDGSIRMTRKYTTNRARLQRLAINIFSDFIISNSKAGLEIYKVPLGKSSFIHNGFAFSRTNGLIEKVTKKNKLGINGQLVVGMVARLDFEKDWKTFFKAAINLLRKRNDVIFVIVGDGNQRQYYEALVDSNKSSFVFTGLVNNVESYVNIFDIAILSSYSEGISNSIMEYMALRKPVIASGSGGVTELVKANETGFIFNVGDNIKLEEFILKLLDDANLRSTMGNNAYNLLETSFSIETMIEQYTKSYRSLS